MLEDMTSILALVARFNDKYHDVPLDPIKTADMVAWVIEDGVCFVSDKGFIGGVVLNDLTRTWTLLQEFGWFAEDKSGIKLLKAFIAEARNLEVDEVRICTLETSSPIAGRILKRMGFAPLETSYRLLIGADTCQSSQPLSP